jgi:hypothetical protein
MSPTLVLMLKAPAAGAVKTRLAATVGAARATEIYRSLVERQVRALPEGWPVVICFDPPEAGAAMRAWLTPLRPKGTEFCTQGAGDLGRRLTLAAAAAFGAGAQAVVLIGGDCPYLAHTHLAEAATALRGERVVLGPPRCFTTSRGVRRRCWCRRGAVAAVPDWTCTNCQNWKTWTTR